MDLHLKREEGKGWTPMTGEGAPKEVEGQSAQQAAATLEGKKAENGVPAGGGAESQGAAGGSQAAQAEPVKQPSQTA